MPLISTLGVSNRRSRGKQPNSRQTDDLELNEKSSNYKKEARKSYSNPLSFLSLSYLRLQFLKFALGVKHNKHLFRRVTTLIILIFVLSRIYDVFSPPAVGKSQRYAAFRKATKKNIIHPRTIGYYFNASGTVIGFSKIFNHHEKSDFYEITRQAFENDIDANALKSSKKYRDLSLKVEGPFITKDCIQLYDWQLDHFPTCNRLHEIDVLEIRSGSTVFLANGHFRDVWSYNEYDGVNKLVFKTLRYRHDFTKRNHERHNRDAMSMERLTKSPNVVNIFGFCGNSGIFEYASDGDMEKAILEKEGQRQRLSKIRMMQLALQVSLAITDLHIVEKEPPIVHADISPAQFVLIDGVYKLNDFNRCRYLRRNVTSSGICGFKVGNNPGRRRAPEEYKYELEDEKIDVFSMGHIFYSILTGKQPFLDYDQKKVYKKVMKGDLPLLDDELQESSDPVHVVLKTAMKMCYTYKAKERPSASEVLKYLSAQYKSIYPDDNFIKR